MHPKELTVLIAQMNATVGAIGSNTEKIIAIIERYQQSHDLIVFPELALTGYPPEDLIFQKEFAHEVERALAKIIQKTTDTCIIIGHPKWQQTSCFNTATVIQNQAIVTYCYKQCLPNYGVFDERRYFLPGETSCFFTLKGKKIGLCICEDLWQEGPVEKIIASGSPLLIAINASPFDSEKYDQRVQLLKSYAQQGLQLIYVNLVGGQDELVFDGQSLAFDATGALCCRAEAFKEDYVTVSIKKENVSGKIASLLSPDELLYKALCLGLHDYVEKNHFREVLLGLSGGIDSALVLALAVDALGADRVHAVLMPSRYTATISNEVAKKQLDTMHVSYSILPIEPCFEAVLNTLVEPFAGLPPDITEENIQARIRGLLLMALSNKTGRMVISTSNKSETAVGYSTLYGDMVGGFAVLKDVLKTQVYRLANYRNQVSPVIPQEVISRPPSAELAPNQTDQDCLPPYNILDNIIALYMETNSSAEAIIEQGFDKHIVYRIIQLIKRNEYKRRQAPPGVKISTRAFGRDWRFPITGST